MPQPVEQRHAVWSLQNILQGIFAPRFTYALPQRQQVKVMIAEQALCCVTECHQAAQYAQRVRSPVHQIT